MSGELAIVVRFRLDDVLAAREKRGEAMSLSELSRRSGVSYTTVHSIANNKTAQVSLATLDSLCEALAVKPGDLLEREAPKRRGR